MKRRQTKKELNKKLDILEKVIRREIKPTVQEAWDIVAEHTEKLGVAYCLFTKKDYPSSRIILFNHDYSFKLISKPIKP